MSLLCCGEQIYLNYIIRQCAFSVFLMNIWCSQIVSECEILRAQEIREVVDGKLTRKARQEQEQEQDKERQQQQLSQQQPDHRLHQRPPKHLQSQQQQTSMQQAPSVKALQRFKSISSGNLIDLPIEDDKKTIAERMRNKRKS